MSKLFHPVEKTDIRMSAFGVEGYLGKLIQVMAPPIEWLFGITKLRKMFDKENFHGLGKYQLLENFIKTFDVKYDLDKSQIDVIPREGPLIIVANHPLGGLEGIILPYLLKEAREDLKILVNFSLKVIKELRDFFIFINNVIPNYKGNYKSINDCRKWVKNGHCLMLFPAGWVGYYRRDKGYVTDAAWSRIAINMAHRAKADILPIYVEGEHSTLFNWMSRVCYWLNPLMLARELFYSVKKKISFQIGKPIAYKEFKDLSYQKANNYIRMRTYLLKGVLDKKKETSATKSTPGKNIIHSPQHSPPPLSMIEQEIKKLPADHLLLESGDYSVHYSHYSQIPQTVIEICRLRNLSFKDIKQESTLLSGPDQSDKTYTHIFAWDNKKKKIAGACRVGEEFHTLSGVTGIYLDQHYHLHKEITEPDKPHITVGSQFVVPDRKESASNLNLLNQGVGRYITRTPGSRYLLASLPLIKPYMEASTALIVYALIGKKVREVPWIDFDSVLHREVEDYIDSHGMDMRKLSHSVKALEEDNKGIPSLLKLYARMGARFISIAKDVTGVPGLFFILDLSKVPEGYLKRYLGEKYREHLESRE